MFGLIFFWRSLSDPIMFLYVKLSSSVFLLHTLKKKTVIFQTSGNTIFMIQGKISSLSSLTKMLGNLVPSQDSPEPWTTAFWYHLGSVGSASNLTKGPPESPSQVPWCEPSFWAQKIDGLLNLSGNVFRMAVNFGCNGFTSYNSSHQSVLLTGKSIAVSVEGAFLPSGP